MFSQRISKRQTENQQTKKRYFSRNSMDHRWKSYIVFGLKTADDNDLLLFFYLKEEFISKILIKIVTH